MTSKKVGGLLLKIVLSISYYFSKKTDLCSPQPQRFEKMFAHESKTGISLENILNLFKCLIVSLVPLKFYLWQQEYFLLFWLASSMNLLWCQVCIFYCSLSKKRGTLLPEGTDIHIQQHIHQKDLNFCLKLYYYARLGCYIITMQSKVIVELAKTQTRNSTVFWCL